MITVKTKVIQSLFVTFIIILSLMTYQTQTHQIPQYDFDSGLKMLQDYFQRNNNSYANNQYESQTDSYKKNNLTSCLLMKNQVYFQSIENESKLINFNELAAGPHGFRTRVQYQETINLNVQDQKIRIAKRSIQIAIKYFYQILRVTNIYSQQIKIDKNQVYEYYKSQFKNLNKYTQIGFNPQQVDSVIFIDGILKPGAVAGALPLKLLKWPVFGLMLLQYNNFLKRQNPLEEKISTIIHQFSHVFGFHPSFFQSFFESYTSNKILLYQQVVRINPFNQKYNMIITQNVKKYIKSYFQCDDPNVGALLQNNGGIGTAGFHWERTVYYNDYMTSSVMTTDIFFTELTLRLFQDTGFYYDVVKDFTDKPVFGKGRGCNFLFAVQSYVNSQNISQFCDLNKTQECVFYGTGMGKCIQTTYSRIVQGVKQKICEPVSKGKTDQGKRCFFKKQNDIQSFTCYESTCESPKQIKINVNNYIVNCSVNSEVIQISTVPYFSITCPKNIQAYCAMKQCQNWCGDFGLCLDGFCEVKLQCNEAIPNCQVCNFNYLPYFCQTCSLQHFLTQNKQYCLKLANCSQGFPYCKRCQLNSTTLFIQCVQCIKNAAFFLYNKKKICLPNITNCTHPYTIQQNGQKVVLCQTCSLQHFLTQNKQYCLKLANCSRGFPYCKRCQLNSTTLFIQCVQCIKNAAFFYNEKKICLPDITNCTHPYTIQQNGQKVVLCSMCLNGFLTNHDNSKCLLCSQGSEGCQICIANLCRICNKSKYYQVIKNDGVRQCKKMQNSTSNCLSNCLTCQEQDRNKCHKCPKSFFNKQYKCIKCLKGCQICEQQTTCLQCSINFKYLFTECQKKCQQPCYTCHEDSLSNCLTCDSGWVLKQISSLNKTCQLKYPIPIQNCKFSGGQYCYQCLNGYYLTNEKKLCQACPIIPYCKYCDPISISSCINCIKNAFLNQTTKKCQPCSQQCNQCIQTNICVSCTNGYSFDKLYKCSPNQRLQINLKLNFQFSNFIASDQFIKIKNKINQILNEFLLFRNSSFVIESVSEGSVVIQGYVVFNQQVSSSAEVDLNTKLCQTKNKLKQTLSAGSQIEGYQISEFNIDQSSLMNNVQCSQESSTTTIIILAIVIPFVIILIILFVIVGVLIRKRNMKKDNSKQNNQKTQNQITQNKKNTQKENFDIKTVKKEQKYRQKNSNKSNKIANQSLEIMKNENTQLQQENKNQFVIRLEITEENFNNNQNNEQLQNELVNDFQIQLNVDPSQNMMTQENQSQYSKKNDQ